MVESIEFDVKDGRSLMEDLLYTPKMCMDDAISGALHPGQTSFRQFGTTGSLHASVGPGAKDADAHVDKLTPPKGKNADHTCDQDMPEAMRHIGQEVVPEKVRGKTHIPGFQLNPDFINTHPGAPSGAVTDPAQRDDPHMSAGITLNF